jgi:hypothetical protein
MMEDWTDIIGEELENIEEPLPADDWSVLQQKYAAAQRRKKAAAFAWAGGVTSVAAAIALVLLFTRPESIVVENDLVTENLPPTEETVPVDSSHVESPIDTVLNVAPCVQNKFSVLVAEHDTDVIRDTTSLKDDIFADASTSNEDMGTFGFDDFPEDEPSRKRLPMSIGISGSASAGPLLFRKYGEGMAPPNTDENQQDSTRRCISRPSMAMKRGRTGYSDSFRHELPISFGLSARIFLTDRLAINTGLSYTRYSSLRSRFSYDTNDLHKDWQYAHYLGIPVRLDWMAVNKKHFNLYLGAGLQADKCVYAIAGNERLYEREVLFGLNGAMGLQVNIVPMVGLYIEPEVSYALNKGSIETFRSDEPFVITARGGLRFNF